MHMDDALHLRASFVKPGVNKYFLRRIQAVTAGNFFAVEIDGDNIARADETEAAFFRPARFDENPVFTRHSDAHMTAWLFGQVKFAENTAGLRNRLLQL